MTRSGFRCIQTVTQGPRAPGKRGARVLLPEFAPESEAVLDSAMRAALVLAQKAASQGEVPVGAVIVYQGEIIAEAYNLRETTHDPLAHAEILAIRKASEVLGRWRLYGCTLVVTLEPCCMCAGAIVNSRLERVEFAAWDKRAGAAGSLCNLVQDPRFNHRAQLRQGRFEVESAQLLRNFFAVRRRDAKSGL